MRFLLDTNILSEPIKPYPDSSLMDALREHRNAVTTAAPVWNELLFGCYRLPPSGRRRMLESYLHQTLAPGIPILPYDDSAAAWHAAERARLCLAGQTPAFVDGQIAAIAATHNLTLITRNVEDFANFQGLVCDNWFSK